MAKALVIVESPAKAKTINKYLGKNYIVKASIGHVKDLPKRNLSVDVENGFRPTYEVIEGKIAMDLIKPVSVLWMWISRAMGESAFRLGLLTAPTAVVIALIFPIREPASGRMFALFMLAALGSFFLMGAINFMVGTCAIPLKSILALIRTKYWLIELLSGLLIPMSFFPKGVQNVLAWLPFEHIAYTPLQIYLGKLDFHRALIAVGEQWCWVIALLALAHFWWERSLSKITIHGG